MANEYLKYTSKDYNSIYTDLVSAIPSITDLWTNTEDGDPGIVLVKLMSALGDMLSYNMDKQALEYYSSTVTQRKNAAKLFNLIGYKMHWYRSATNRISVTNNIVTPLVYQAVADYRSYLVYVDIPNKTKEQQEEMVRLEKAYKDEADTYVAPKYPEADYPAYYDDDHKLIYDDTGYIPLISLDNLSSEYGNKYVYSMKVKVVEGHHCELRIKGEK